LTATACFTFGDHGNDRIEVFDQTGALKRVVDVKPGTAYSPGAGRRTRTQGDRLRA
jgi:hypothetical protein